MLVSDIICDILPNLKSCALYSQYIQDTVQKADKQKSGSAFSQALSDADTSIQTAVEIELLARFPGLLFFGEEKSVNSKYFRGSWFQSESDSTRAVCAGTDVTPLLEQQKLLALLDPIDGTRFYLDNLDYQLVFSLASASEMLASIVLMPRKDRIFYAEKGRGLSCGNFSQEIVNFSKVSLENSEPTGLASVHIEMGSSNIPGINLFLSLDNDYNGVRVIPNMFNLLNRELSVVVVPELNLHDNYALAFMVEEAGGSIVVPPDTVGLPVPASLGRGQERIPLVIASSVRLAHDVAGFVTVKDF